MGHRRPGVGSDSDDRLQGRRRPPRLKRGTVNHVLQQVVGPLDPHLSPKTDQNYSVLVEENRRAMCVDESINKNTSSELERTVHEGPEVTVLPKTW